jgi:tetratricopeptide (TPR) repeat protein
MDFTRVMIGASIVALSISVIGHDTPLVFAQNDTGWKFCTSDSDTPELPAISYCTRLINDNRLSKGDLAQVYYRRGAAYLRKGDIGRAIADETMAIELDQKLSNAYVRRGAAYLQKRDFEGAIADTSKAIEIDPDNVKAYVSRSVARAFNYDVDGALADSGKAVEIDPKSISAYLARATSYTRQNDQISALAELSRATEIDPNGGYEGYGSRGRAFLRKGDYTRDRRL